MKNKNGNPDLLDYLYEGIYFVDKDRTITSWNKGAQNITGFSATDVVNSKCYNNILNHVDQNGNKLCFSGCPLYSTMEDGIPREAKVFLHHKKGYRVPVSVKTIPMYGKNDEIIGAIEIFLDDKNKVQILSSLEKYRKEATEDALTGIPNRRFIQTVLNSRHKEYVEFGMTYGIAFIDIDDFKKVNDVYGHDIGDEILKMIAKTLEENLRKQDAICRWGGEEFVIVFSDVDSDEIHVAAEKIRMLVEQSGLRVEKENNQENKTINVTISIGVTISNETDLAESIIKRADALMYQSKQKGKNMVTIG